MEPQRERGGADRVGLPAERAAQQRVQVVVPVCTRRGVVDRRKRLHDGCTDCALERGDETGEVHAACLTDAGAVVGKPAAARRAGIWWTAAAPFWMTSNVPVSRSSVTTEVRSTSRSIV